MKLTVNSKEHDVAVDDAMPLLWVLRDTLGLTGTKFGCGMGLCGACTVHVDGKAVRACATPVSEVAGKAVTTIEGIATKKGGHPVVRAWCELDVAQCGYCQPGQVMAAAALLEANAHPKPEEVDAAMMGNLCRCGTYQRIRAGIARACEMKEGK